MVSKITLLIVFILSVFGYSSLLSGGLPPTHDGEYHVIRFFEFDKTLRDGNLYPRWAADLNNGFGVPLFNYVYPLPNYAASILHAFNFSFIDSFKLSMLFAILIGGIFFYLWTKEFFGNFGGLVSSVVYTFSPYHFLDVFIRGSVGEVWALGLFPAFLWAITKYIQKNERKFAIYSILFLSFVIFSHNILSLMFFVFSIFYAFILKSKNKKNIVWVFMLSLGLTSIFYLPAILERQFVRGLEVYDYSTNFAQFYQLIFPSWGSGFSGGSLQNQLSFQIGIANLIAVFLSLIVLLRKKANKKIIKFFILSFLIVFVLMLKISLPIWQNFPFMNYFQFPWRFLSLEILITSFLAGSIVYLWKQKIFGVFLIIISILLGLGYSKPAYFLKRDDNYYISRANFIDGTNSPGNSFNTIWMKDGKKQKDKIKILGNGIFKTQQIKSTDYKFEVDMKNDGKIIVNSAYFPGWTVFDNDNIRKTSINKEGLFSFETSKGRHNISVKLEDTIIRKISTYIFFISLLTLLLKITSSVKIKR